MGIKIFHNVVPVTLAQGNKISDVEVLRVGTIQDRGFKITQKMLDEYVLNFEKNVYGTEIQVNLEHNRGSVAAGWIKNLYVKNEALFATVEWTDLGIEHITKNLFKFVSAELADNYPHHETGKKVDNVFIGLALTNTPALKGQSPIALSEKEKQLFNKRMLKILLENLKKRSFVSSEDKAIAKQLFDEATPEDQEANKEAAADVAAKPETAEPTPEEKAAKEAADKKAADEAKAKADAEAAAGAGGNLKEKVDAQKFKEMETELHTLKEEVKKNKVTALAETFMISEQRATGFAGTAKAELVAFLMELAPEIQQKFETLMSKVSTVELKTLGGNGVKADKDDEDRDAFISKRAEKLMGEGKMNPNGKPMTIEDAQKCAAKEYEEKAKK